MLEDTVFESNHFIEFLKQKLKRTFDKFPDYRTLYIDEQILHILNFIYGHNFQQFKKVQKVEKSIYQFSFDQEQGYDVSENPTIIFFLYPKVDSMKKIADIILKNSSQNIKKEYFLLLTPKKTFLCIDELENRKVLSKIKVQSFNFDLIPLYKDLLSLQLKNAYFDLMINKNQTIIKVIVQSILKLQSIYGTFKYTFSKGQISSDIVQLVKTKMQDQKFEKKQSQYQISLFLFDRGCDLITPMLTPFTYETALDMKYNIKLNKISIKAQIIGQKGQKDGKSNYLLYNPKDQEYTTISRKYIKILVAQLEQKAKVLENQIRKKPESNVNAIQQLSELQKIGQTKLAKYLAIKNHFSIVLSILKQLGNIASSNRLEIQSNMVLQRELNLDSLEYLSLFFDVQNLLRLVCLASAINSGLKDKLLKNIQQIIIRNYGIAHAFTFKNLKEIGLISHYISKGNWTEIKKNFSLINQNTDYKNPNDYSYIFIVYASLITRMLEQGIYNPRNWINNRQKYNLVKGPTQVYEHKSSQYSKKDKKTLYFVYFVGGVTYAQIQSIRFLSEKLKKQIIICTTNTTNGNLLVRQCFDQDLFNNKGDLIQSKDKINQDTNLINEKKNKKSESSSIQSKQEKH